MYDLYVYIYSRASLKGLEATVTGAGRSRDLLGPQTRSLFL